MGNRDLSDAVFTAIKGYVDTEVDRRVKAAVEAAVAALPVPKDGAPGAKGDPGERGEQGLRGDYGAPGAKGDPGERGEPGARGEAGERGAAGEKGESGARGDNGQPGEKGEAGERGQQGEKGERGETGERGEAGQAGERGERGEPGQKGDPGERGESGAAGERGAPGERGEKGLDGERGERGEKGDAGHDGKSITLEDVQPIVDLAITRGLLDLERRGADVLQRAIERIQPPKDGAPGRDGIDGLGFDDLTAEQKDDRTVAFVFKRGDVEKRFEFTFPTLVDCGTFKAGQTYPKGGSVTYGGSLFIAQRETLPTERPEDGSGAFRLAVKRGRDGGGS